MSMKNTATILGLKKSKGDFNGRPYDSTILYQQVKLKEGEDFIGAASEEIKWGTSVNFDLLKASGITCPFVAELTLELVSNGRSSTLVVIDLKPQVQAQK